MIAVAITSQSCQMLSQRIIRRCAVFWHLTGVQTHGSVTHTGSSRSISHPQKTQPLLHFRRARGVALGYGSPPLWGTMNIFADPPGATTRLTLVIVE